MDAARVDQVRRFNRELTRRIGVLGEDYLGRGRPLGASRVLFEIGREGAELRGLRLRLGLDSGYLSRLLRSLEAAGLARTQRSTADARVRCARLTRKGLAEWAVLDRRSQALAHGLLAPLGERQQQRLLAAMADVERLLRAAGVTIEPADPAGAEAQACIAAYLGELDARFPGGFDPARSVSADPQELVPPAGVFLLARLDGDAVGCGGLKRVRPGVGEIKRMWVAPGARGLGIAQRLLEALEHQAMALRLREVQLDTNRTLVEARALYQRNGYREVPAYNDNPYADHWFAKRLPGGARRRAQG